MPESGLLLVCDFNAHGGTQTQVLELLAGLDRRRFRPVLATLHLDSALAARVEALGVEIRDLGLAGALRPGTFRAMGELAAFARARRVKLVHGFLLHGNVVAALAARRAGVPYLTSVRNLELWKGPLEEAASRWAHRHAAAVTFNSRHVRDLVARRERIPLAKTRVIPNGLRDEALAGSPAGPGAATSPWPEGAGPKLVCAASLTPKKGHRYLLEAFALVAATYPRAALLLAGTGPERAFIEERVRALGLGSRVVLAGYRPEARALIASADLLLLASIEEGMPNVLLEAMAAGVAQVATRVGGAEEAVEEGVTGFLVPPRDPVLLAERALKILGDDALRRRMGEASRARFAERFSTSRMAGEHEALYASLMGEPA